MSDAPPSAKSSGAVIVRPNDAPLVRRGKREPGLSSRNGDTFIAKATRSIASTLEAPSSS
jgi:hypothetical protein